MTDIGLMEKLRDVWDAEREAIGSLAETLDAAALQQTVALLAGCEGRILTSGCGTSGAAAKKIAHTLCCVDRPAAFLAPSDAAHGALGLLRPEDVLILISKGGGTAELLGMVPACRAIGAALVAVTENPGSPLAKSTDIVLPVRVGREPCPFNMLATASTIAVVALFDAICIALMEVTGYTRERFAVIHPGGAVGVRLADKSWTK